jgi:hypothetical protein
MQRTGSINNPSPIGQGSVRLVMVFAPLEANAGCRQSGGIAEMPTRAVAEFMADAALKNAIGPITMKCKDDTLTTTCTARRRACD